MLNERPLICCTTAGRNDESDPRRRILEDWQSYPLAILAAGGIPLSTNELCPEEMAELCDGLVLTGGADIDPDLYGEEIFNDTVKPDPIRTAFEVPLTRAFLERKKPILCICRGFQLMNALLGGDLWQDTVAQLGYVHMNRDIRHPVFAEEGSVLYRLFGREFRVNSTHHQAVKTPGRGLRVTARSVEGIIEAYEHESLPIWGTQFHPERLTGILWDDRTPDFAPYFRFFVEETKKDAQGRESR